jgi:hypothetical protein
MVETTSWYEQMNAANEAANLLEKIHAELEATHTDVKTGCVDMFCSYECFFLEHQIEHLRSLAKQENNAHSLQEVYSAYLSNFAKKTIALITHFWKKITRQAQTQLLSLAELIVEFATFERKFVLNDINRFSLFLKKRNTLLPKLINFWNNPDLIRRAGLRVERNNRNLQIQAASFFANAAAKAATKAEAALFNPAMAGQALFMGVGGIKNLKLQTSQSLKNLKLQQKIYFQLFTRKH